MRTITKGLFKFDELSGEAKEAARDWCREGMLDYEWWDSVYEDAATVANILGIDLRTQRYKINISFSGFSSQGDGAHFEGTYRYKHGSVEAIKEYAPQEEDLLHIAERLRAIQALVKFESGAIVCARVKYRGRYQHEGCTEIEVFGEPEWDEEIAIEEAGEVIELLRSFMRWIYRKLEQEYDYRNSDECVDENIRANDYEFDEEGGII